MASHIDDKAIQRAYDQLDDLFTKAKRAGADAADGMIVDASSLSVSWCNGKIESLEQSEAADVGLRVLIGKKQAMVATTDRRAATLDEIVARAVAMAKDAPEDQYCGLADTSDIATSWPQIEMADSFDISAEGLIDQAREGEAAALAVKGITLCESSDAGAGESLVVLAATNGFRGHYKRTNYGLSVSALTGEGTAMERDYDFASRVFQSDLPTAASIGTRAGERAMRNVGARKMPTCSASVVFAPRVSNSLLGNFASAINGSSVARGTSFLKDRLNKAVFSSAITITDDPLRQRGPLSRIFDAEGLPTQKRRLVDAGIVATWILDLSSARQLGLKSTGHASRSPGGTPHPSPSNLYIEPGQQSAEALIKDIKTGFYITELMGFGVNGVTGDYSRSARGFWIENGVVTFPVNEMTIAGNLKDMFMNMTPASDLEFRYGYNAPTLRVEGMTIAGI